MQPDTIPAPRPVLADPAGTRVIFRNAQRRIDHLWATGVPFTVKVESHLDILLEVAFELDRLARHRDMSVLSKKVEHGDQG